MATRQGTVDFLLEQTAIAGVSARKMFGEYALYCEGKLVALVCDDRLFLKPTAAGRRLLGTPEEQPPYPSAKPCFVVAEDVWEDGATLAALVKATAAELPLPVVKARKIAKTPSRTLA